MVTSHNHMRDMLILIAKIYSVVIVIMFLFVILAEIIAPQTGPLPAPYEIAELIFFPGGVLVGLFVACWHKKNMLLGSSIALGSFITFFILEMVYKGGFPGGPLFFMIMIPVGLFFTCYFLKKREKTENNQ